MSKTFKSAHSDNKALKVDELFGNPRLLIKAFDGDTRGFAYAPSDAPALALAILEAAGYDDKADDMSQAESYAFDALHKLQQSVDEQERATAEAREQAELEAEALELINAWMDSCGAGEYPSWAQVESSRRKQGLAVARKAREMRAEK